MTSLSIRARRFSALTGPDAGRWGSSPAFSLVEVAMALGIASFVLISLLGLMTVSLDAGKRAYEDTTVANITQVVMSEIRTNNFTNLGSLPPDRYFSYEGTSLPTQDGAYYRCNIQSMAHSSADLPASARQSSAGLRVRLLFFWPPTNSKTNEIFETTVAKY